MWKKDAKKIKTERFAEEYNDHNIYFKDGLYYPYWECQYAFDTLEGVKKRIDDMNVATPSMYEMFSRS